MESNKQEKYNLMHDNPVAKHASGGSWMSKHSNSAFQMGHSPNEMKYDSPAEYINPVIATKAAKAVKTTAKKVAKGVKKVAKKIKEDLFEGGFERTRKLNESRGIKPANVFKK